MLMLMVTEFLTQMTELTWESNTESDYGIQFTLNYKNLDLPPILFRRMIW
jgi:hypothetical protein